MQTAFVKDQNEIKPITFTYQNITIPFIDSKMNEISILGVELQKLLLILKRDINFLNNDINHIWFFNSKTVSIDYDYLGRLDKKETLSPEIIVLAIGLLFSGIFVAVLCSAIGHILRNQQALQEGQIEILNACKD